MKDGRYAKQPRRGERLYRGTDEILDILAVRDRGRVLEVRDRTGRTVRLERAERGWWLVVRP